MSIGREAAGLMLDLLGGANPVHRIVTLSTELTEGTSVVTGGGIYGTVKSIDLTKNTVEVKIARDVVITVDRGSVFKDSANTPLQK